jgi:UDP-N-acetylglucosamine 2-epimerase
MRKVCILYSGRADYHLMKFLYDGMIGFDSVVMVERYIPADITVVLGDRYEALVQSAVAIRDKSILVHLHGGEVSKGSTDDMFRNAITKLAHYHLTATELSRTRVIEMGESPERVQAVGSLGVQRVRHLRKYPKKRDQIVFT